MRTTIRSIFAGILLAIPALAQAQFVFTTNIVLNVSTNITITQYTGSSLAVTVPNSTNGHPVTAIGSGAFFGVPTMTSLTLGTNVTTLGDFAVFQCPNLTTVVMPPSVTNFGMAPFLDCNKLTTITLSNAFYFATNNVLFNRAVNNLIQYPGGLTGTYNVLAAVTNVNAAFIGNSLSAILADTGNTIYYSSNSVLFNKNKTQLIAYPGSLAGAYTVPTNVQIILSASFEYASGVTSISIPTNVSNIGQNTFYDCTNLTAINVSPTNPAYCSTNGVLMDKKRTQLIQYPSGLAGTFNVPATVTNIGEGAFGDAYRLTSVNISDNVTNISFESFYSCTGLKSVSLGKGLKNIEQDAFFFCAALTHIVIPGSVTNIGFEAFGGCQNLTNVCFQGKPPTDGGSIFFFDQSLHTILYLNGNVGWGPTYDSITATPCSTCISSPPLTVTSSGTNVILSWPAEFTTFTLQSTTNPVTPAVWATVSPAPVYFNGNNVVTNSHLTPSRTFYRLMSTASGL